MKLSSIVLTVLSLSGSSFAAQAASTSIRPGQIQNLVTFGDSYTDTVAVSNGGTAWPIYTASYAHVKLFPFARSGATCSNNITFRPFPPVFESQLPTYFAEVKNGTLKLHPQDTLYTLWIGTNDVGVSSLLTGDNKASIVDVANCMVNWVKVMYDSGARNFLFQNIIPLDTVPLYAPNSWPNRFWHLERNTTEWSVYMRELVLSGNALVKLMLQDLASKLHDAHIGLFDSHSLFADMFAHPARYLNGTAPLNVTGAVNTCVFKLNSEVNTCTRVEGTDRDSYLWFDELHPSEQADRVVAREVAETIQGRNSRWTTWLS